MNLEDVLDPEYGLQQDKWSLTRPKFGKEGQLEVIGWSGKYKTSKYYIVRCRICRQDAELFDSGYFRSFKGSLNNGSLPCGCGKKHNWNYKQASILCKRKSEKMGYTFVDFVGEYVGCNTKTRLSCIKHGEWSTGSFSALIHQDSGCPGCSKEGYIKGNKKSDQDMINLFLSTGKFSPHTSFERSERKTSQGAAGQYWIVICPDCGEIAEAFSGNLLKGQKPCACTKNRQKYAYINVVKNNENTPICLKFGIANDPSKRVRSQNWSSLYTVSNMVSFCFESVQACRDAERECFEAFYTGLLSKEEMPDGYTETTHLYNLEKIIEIYEKHGGIRIN